MCRKISTNFAHMEQCGLRLSGFKENKLQILVKILYSYLFSAIFATFESTKCYTQSVYENALSNLISKTERELLFKFAVMVLSPKIHARFPETAEKTAWRNVRTYMYILVIWNNLFIGLGKRLLAKDKRKSCSRDWLLLKSIARRPRCTRCCLALYTHTHTHNGVSSKRSEKWMNRPMDGRLKSHYNTKIPLEISH